MVPKFWLWKGGMQLSGTNKWWLWIHQYCPVPSQRQVKIHTRACRQISAFLRDLHRIWHTLTEFSNSLKIHNAMIKLSVTELTQECIAYLNLWLYSCALQARLQRWLDLLLLPSTSQDLFIACVWGRLLMPAYHYHRTMSAKLERHCHCSSFVRLLCKVKPRSTWKYILQT